MYTIGNLLSSALYLFLIAVTSTSVGYFLMGLQTAFSPFVYFVVNIFLCLLAIEGLMLFVASILPRALEGILTIVVIQVHVTFFQDHSMPQRIKIHSRQDKSLFVIFSGIPFQ